MKYLKQLSIILLICLLAEFLVELLPFSFPSSIMAMIVLCILLLCQLIKVTQIKEVSDILLEFLPFFIVPSSITVIQYLSVIQEIWFKLFVICIVSLIVAFLSCVFTIRFLMKFISVKE